MEILAALGGGAFVLASLVVGLRLMWLARRTRGLSELIMGLGLFFMGGVSYPITLAAFHGESLPLVVRQGMVWSHMVFNTVGMTLIALFTLRVFRPGEAWARGLVALVAVGYLVPMALQVFGPGVTRFLETMGQGPWKLSQLAAVGAPLWAGWESLRYRGMLRKRLALGLVEPELVDRFRLWCVAMWCASSVTALSTALEVAGIAMMGSLAGALVVGPMGVVIAVALWLAFFPPRTYLRRVRRSAEAATAAA